MEYQTHTFNNGIRLIHSKIKEDIAYCGLIVNTGSRNEDENEQGLAHFIEHALFKGTNKRRSFQILNRMENVGGDINAYTTKEETCIYTAFLKQHYPRSIELMTDIVFNAIFPEKELEKEKEVIIDEINSYKDNPSEMIFDEFEELIFKNHPLGHSILGKESLIRNYTRSDLINFKTKNYLPDRIIIFSLGNISFNRLKNIIEKQISNVPEKHSTNILIENPLYKNHQVTERKQFNQLHAIIGNSAYNMWDEKRYALNFLNNLLGGSSLNSRLSMALRERNGYVYDIESNYTAYSDIGIFNIYFGTDKEKFDKSMRVIFKEFQILKSKKLGILQLSRAKQQMIGQIAIGMDNKESLAYSMGRSYMIYNKADGFKDMVQKIESITAEQIMEVANEVLNKDNLSYLIYKPE